MNIACKEETVMIRWMMLTAKQQKLKCGWISHATVDTFPYNAKRN